MSPSEIAFLALGIVVGTAVGAALVQLVRHRPTPRREVRLTITPNAIPARRASTLAIANGAAYLGPIPGSPDPGMFADPLDSPLVDERQAPPVEPAPAPVARTRVPSAAVIIPADAVGVPVGGTPASVRRETRSDPAPDPRQAPAAMITTLEVGTAVLGSPRAGGAPLAPPRPPMQPRPELPGRDDTFTTLVRPRPPASDDRPVLMAGAVAVGVASVASERAPIRASVDPAGNPAAGPEPVRSDPEVDPCAGSRRMVDERCALADVTREQARRAADALREAQRAYDVLRDRVDRAQAQADPRHVAAAKERLHAAFRAASDRSATPEETEAAARAWLGEINQLNAAVREAQRILESGGAELRAQLPVLDRLAAQADAARISNENAEAGCRAAREELAGCEEEQARAREAVPPPAEDPHPFEKVWPVERPELQGSDAAESPGDRLTGLPVIVRILGGDRAAREQVVAALAAGEPGNEHEWQMRLARLVDAITARAVEDGYLDLPEDDSFWRLFDHRESRDIVGALSALGFRYDGLGGFADGRVPAPRDLSLAVGYAGLDRMRIRTWPRDSEIAGLYSGAVVASGEWLADQAGDLSLGRMVDALGGRATDLADIWNVWGRMRPALLAS